MKTITTLLCVFFLTGILWAENIALAQQEIQQAPQVKTLAKYMQKTLDKIDGSMARLIESSAGKINNETEIRVLLTASLKGQPAVVTSNFIDNKGVLLYTEPAEYKEIEGSDISKQDHIRAMMKQPEPIFSSVFKAVEGFASVAIARPLFDDKKNYVGSLVLTIDPALLVTLTLKNNKVPAEFELWTMQTDGMIVGEQDQEEIGKILFTDPMYDDYKTLRILGKKMISEPSGEGEYSFYATGTTDVVTKQATWDTISLHGRNWIVVLVRRV